MKIQSISRNLHSPIKIAAVLLLILVISACSPETPPAAPEATQAAPAAPTQAPAQPVAPTQAPSPTQPADLSPASPLPPTLSAAGATSKSPAPSLVFIFMKTPETGWAMSDEAVYHTANGGGQWQDMSPQDKFNNPASLHAFFLDDSTGWVMATTDVLTPTAGTPSGRVYRTMDGGQSWKSSETPFGGGQMFFVDTKNGWTLDATNCGAGSCGGAVYRTSDGGASWAQVSPISPDNANPNSLPFSGDKNGISFRDTSHGWVGGSEPREGYAWFFASQDGGQNWNHVDLPVPSGYQTATLSVDTPRFFSAQEGILEADIFNTNAGRIFYHTQDGGTTWTPTSPVESSGVFDCSSAQVCWVWDGSVLFKTQDSGKTWSQVTPNVDLSQTIFQLNLINPNSAYVLTMDSNGHSQLYKTADGGSSWGLLIP